MRNMADEMHLLGQYEQTCGEIPTDLMDLETSKLLIKELLYHQSRKTDSEKRKRS
ncbi:MAG: hypothetical protein HQL87_13465 [Magnetococcales bacterium]|nr:hypothetical protein [Magnetococcales bacterium]